MLTLGILFEELFFLQILFQQLVFAKGLQIILKYFSKSKLLCCLENEHLVVKRAFEEDELSRFVKKRCCNGGIRKILKS